MARRAMPGVAIVLALAIVAPSQAAPRLREAHARAAATAVRDIAGRVGARLAAGRCVRIGASRVDCGLVERAGGQCEFVVAARALAGPRNDVLIDLYACPIARRPTAAQRSAARPTDAVRDYLERCPPHEGILFCPPNYGGRPDASVAMLMPGAGLFAASPREPRSITMPEARAFARSVGRELDRTERRGVAEPPSEVRACRPVGPTQIDCEIGRSRRAVVAPSCVALRVTLREDGWLAGDPYDCPVADAPSPAQLTAGSELLATLMARRADACLGPVVVIWPGVTRREPPRYPGPCGATWEGDAPEFVEPRVPCPSRCPRGGGQFINVRVCWRERVRGRLRTVCGSVQSIRR